MYIAGTPWYKVCAVQCAQLSRESRLCVGLMPMQRQSVWLGKSSEALLPQSSRPKRPMTALLSTDWYFADRRLFISN